jgi:hypothetical protein
MPISFNCLFTYTIGKVPTLASLFAKGELLLIAAIITARAMGELSVSSEKESRIPKLVARGGSVIILMITSAWFGLVSAGISTNTGFVSWGSIIVFVAAVCVSGWCILLTER